jgi:1-aminocyclopropane-1-carboxylate deaminase/D-cysteine desulfhydrase-like pyridoxal-dependent ACC family enzyme
LRVTLAHTAHLEIFPHWSFVPFAMWRTSGPSRVVMAPGGATPLGALGYVAAALEVALQVARGEIEAPACVLVGVGSTCTSAGLLVGFAHAARLGIGFREPPLVTSVRVTPWPVTSRFRILSLAVRTSRLLAELAQAPDLALERSELDKGLIIDGSKIGPGYGEPSSSGLEAMDCFRRHDLFQLDTTYSSKAAAGFLAAARSRPRVPLLFWSTKSTVPLPEVTPSALAGVAATARRWMVKCERQLSARGELPADYPNLLETGRG